MSLSISPAKLCHFMLHFFLFLNFIISLFHPDSMQMDSLFIWSFTKRTFSNIFLTKIFHKMYCFFLFFFIFVKCMVFQACTARLVLETYWHENQELGIEMTHSDLWKNRSLTLFCFVVIGMCNARQVSISNKMVNLILMVDTSLHF